MADICLNFIAIRHINPYQNLCPIVYLDRSPRQLEKRPLYGMVNKAIEDMVRLHFGADAWTRILDHAAIGPGVFISNESYPDDLTYSLVTSASEVLGIPPEKVLFAFGEHWALEVAGKDYAEMLSAGGKTLREFLLNLPNFHTRFKLFFPKLLPPRFKISDASENSLTLHYLTHRSGLANFVAGIITGLGKHYQNPVTITQIEHRNFGADHDVFRLEWKNLQPDSTP